MARELPTGTVTFLFTDVEGSTRLLHQLGEETYANALEEHRRLIREACRVRGGVEVDTQGDAFFFAFPTAPAALDAAAATRDSLQSGPIRVRTGIHTGTPLLTSEGYIGHDVHRAARIAAAGHGEQVLVSASTAALLGTDGLHDLGEHRLKDLSAPERIYQLGDDEFPPLKSLHQTNLPIPATPFIGRERELAEVIETLDGGKVRLLTLTGPGGTGKTRLALQAAGALSDRYPHGVWWVPLAPLRNPELALAAAAQVMGAKHGLAEHVVDKSMLLLFDNFEHVVEAAADVAALLGSCPNLNVLVTSRELLRVPGEQAYPVPPLDQDDGTELFTARAHAVDPHFVPNAAVTELCIRLENLPLALELAAARVSILSPAQLLDRLSHRLDLLKGGRGVDPRQQTLRATIEWSHDLLNADEQRLFGRLAVFRGGCTLETAEEVCAANVDTLQSLVDKSLLRHSGERFWMLETIREFAAERLEGSGEADELRRRHAHWFAALAEDAYPHLRGSPKEWLERLEREHDNLRAALDRLEASDERQLALKLAGALFRFWYQRGHHTEGRRRLEEALRADDRPTAARARALNGAAALAAELGDPATPRQWAEEGLTLHRRLGDAWGVAYSVYMLGLAAANELDFARAQPLFEESVRAFRTTGDEHYILLAIHCLAWTYGELGAVDRARPLHEDNLRRARATRNDRMEARSLSSLGAIAGLEGRLRDALPMLAEAYQIRRDLGERVEIADVLSRFAAALAFAQRARTAARVLSSSEALHEETGVRRPWVVKRDDETLATIRAQLDETAFAEAWEQGRALTPDEAVALALDSIH